MILLCELAVKSEALSTTLDNKITTKLLSFLIISFLTEKLNISCADTLSGPVFSTGAMGRIPITLKTHKVVTLPCLGSFGRVHTISLIRKSNVHFLANKSAIIFIYDDLKVKRPRRPHFTLEFPHFNQDRRLCVAYNLRLYLHRTRFLRALSQDQLFISYYRPHKPVTKDSLSRWVKNSLQELTSAFFRHIVGEVPPLLRVVLQASHYRLFCPERTRQLIILSRNFTINRYFQKKQNISSVRSANSVATLSSSQVVDITLHYLYIVVTTLSHHFVISHVFYR